MKLILAFMMSFVSTFCFAQASYGSYTMFPNKKLAGSYYKPQLAFGKVNDQYLLVLCYTDPNAYATFDDESVMLLKFEDDTTVKLPICQEDPVSKKYETSWNSLLKSYNHFYETFTSFVIDDVNVQRVVKNRDLIKKIRVSFTNGDIKDWDIDLKYQPKLIDGLIKSYNMVESKDAVRKENIGDVESGF